MPDVPAVALGAAELPLARNRNFRLLTASQAISAVGPGPSRQYKETRRRTTGARSGVNRVHPCIEGILP